MEEGQKEICALRLDWASNGVLDSQDNEVYRKLYYSSLETCSGLQQQLIKYSGLLSKYRKIAELKDVLLSGIGERVHNLVCLEEDLQLREDDCKAEMASAHLKQEATEKECQDQLQVKEEECERLREALAAAIVKETIALAESQVKEELIQQLIAKKCEVEKDKHKFTKYSQSLKRRYKEMKESFEFMQVERSSLEETNLELEDKVSSLTQKLESRSGAQDSDADKIETELELPEEMGAAVAACSTCSVLKKQLGVVTATLNRENVANYGDMLHTNFLLRQKLSQAESELVDVTMDFQRLGKYFTEYKDKSAEKMVILKDNVKKADEEIAELDKLVESVREALHSNRTVIRDCPHLMEILQELEGGHMS